VALTSKLGIPDSQLGNIQLAGGAISTILISVGNTLVLSQSVIDEQSIINETATSTLSLTQTARGFNGNKRLSQSLALSQVIASQNILKRSITHTISFLQFAAGVRIVRASNIITFTDSSSALNYKGTRSQFATTQDVAMNWTHTERVTQTFLISQSATAGNIYNRTLSNTLVFTQTASAIRARFYNVNSVIAFQGFGSTIKIVQPHNNLVIAQAVTVHKITSVSLSHLLALHQTVVRNLVYHLTPSNILKFNNTHPRDTQILGQHQILSVPTVFVTKPSNMVVLNTSDQAITLKRPLLGDTEGGLSKVLLQRTITGSLFTYVRKNSSRKLKYAFELPKVKALELRGFVRNSLSTPMWLQNWKGEIWFGFITNNPFSFKGKQRWGNQDGEAVDVNIEFEGVRIH
jgi:hypothetical protein